MRQFLALLCVSALCFSTGCKNDRDDDKEPVKPAPVKPKPSPDAKKIDPIVIELEKAITTAGAIAGLREWSKSDPNAAKECATNLSSNITAQLLPYMKDQAKLKTAAEVQQLLQTSIADKFPPQVKTAIIAAFDVLDLYLPVPAPEKYLSENAIQLITAFLEGMRDGCDAFLKTTASRSVKAAWLK